MPVATEVAPAGPVANRRRHSAFPLWVPEATGQEILRLTPYRLQLLGSTGAISSGAESRLKALIGTP